MKKIVTILFTSLFFMSTAFAGGMIGVKLGAGTLDGERTVDPSHGTTNGASGSVDSEYAAIFGEISGEKFAVGLELVPLEGKIDTKATTTTDSTVTISNLATVYALVPFGSSPIYGKLGYSRAELSVKANYTTVTVGAHSDNLEGPMIALGAQFDSPIPFLDVIRVEATHHMFDEVSITTTNTNGTGDTHTKKGEADLTTISLSLAKSF
ncbi:MAG: hypothetical protein HOF20_07890 [Pelagibacteraceae bacterium]|jgi:hypothetical protein|nr:hypothetical protein [Pelagibacteraceae bacterium]